MGLEQQVVGIETKFHIVVTVDQAKHLLAGLAQTGAGQVLDAERRPDAPGLGRQQPDRGVAVPQALFALLVPDRLRTGMQHKKTGIETSCQCDHLGHERDVFSTGLVVEYRDVQRAREGQVDGPDLQPRGFDVRKGLFGPFVNLLMRLGRTPEIVDRDFDVFQTAFAVLLHGCGAYILPASHRFADRLCGDASAQQDRQSQCHCFFHFDR